MNAAASSQHPQDPRRLLAEAYQAWKDADRWEAIADDRPGGASMAIVRPGLQYFSLLGESTQALIHDDRTYLKGALLQSALLSYSVDPARLRATVPDTWVECDTRTWLAGAEDHSAIGMFGKAARPVEPSDVRIARSTADSADILVADAVVTISIRAAAPPLIIRVQEQVGLSMTVTYGQEGVVRIPQIGPGMTLSHAELLTRLRSRSRARRRPNRKAVPIEVLHVDDGWHIRSDHLAGRLGLTTALEAEAVVRQQIGDSDPHLIERLDFDSYDTTFSVYAADEAAAQELAAILRRIAAD